MFAGTIEFAAGRGRIDLSTAVPHPTRSVNGVTIGPLLAHAGDYFLFDSTGYILVRPSSHTFSSVSFSASTYRHGNVREEWDGFFEFGNFAPEPVSPSDSTRLTQHGPFAIRWHLDRLKPMGPVEILARGRIMVADAPRGEASIARWMGVAAALATLRDTVSPLDSHLQLTSVAVLPAQSGKPGETNVILLHPMSDIALAEIDVSRLTLPADYVEAAWPGFENAPNLPARTTDAARHWRAVPAR